MTNAVVFDIAGLVKAFLIASPGLVGKDAPISAVHLSEPTKSPGGVVVTPRAGMGRVDIEGAGHTAPVTLDVRSMGGEEGAKARAERGARALTQVLVGMSGAPVWVEGRDGTRAMLRNCANVQGPGDMGAPNGRALFRVSADFVFTTP